jgi:hypothetical protein
MKIIGVLAHSVTKQKVDRDLPHAPDLINSRAVERGIIHAGSSATWARAAPGT